MELLEILTLSINKKFMKILIVCSGTKENFKFEINQVFINEQMQAITLTHDVNFDIFLNKEKGIIGYLKNYRKLREYLKQNQFDIIHAHYGYSGLLAALQWKVPKIVTYHGTDINQKQNNIISSIAILFSDWNIFVSEKLRKLALIKNKRSSVIPCGINIEEFSLIDMHEAREKLNLDQKKKYILFSSSFTKKVKNYPLASEAVSLLNSDVELLELNGYDRETVNLFLNAADILLMTSYSEGSPQIIKEAMACNLPIVSTNVGEVKNIIGETKGCWLTSFDPEDVADKIKLALEFDGRTNGRSQISEYDNNIIAEKVYSVYKKVLQK